VTGSWGWEPEPGPKPEPDSVPATGHRPAAAAAVLVS